LFFFFFFFQAEDGIRDFHVTGVQTCALPILCGIKILKPKTKHIGLVSAILGFIWLVAVFIFSYVMINLNLEKEKIESFFEENFETKISKADIILNNNDTLNVIFQRDPRVFTINDTISGTFKYS